MRVGDWLAWKEDLVLRGYRPFRGVTRKRYGRITGYEAATGTFTYQPFSWWKRTWLWFFGGAK